jgi:type I restriction enzyme, S subunit
MMDWKTVELGEVCTLQRGMDLPKRLRTDGQFPLVTSSGIDGTHHIGPVKGPGVITGRYGTIGKVFYVESDFWPLNTTLYVRDFHGNDARFVHYLLQTVDFQSHSGKSGVPGVNRNDVHQEWVCVPADKSEQERISQALLDTDTLIESLEQLLTKKRQIKQGAMQELLTGKRRLPGFSGKWEAAELRQLGHCVRGVSYNPGSDLYEGDTDQSVRLLRSNNVQSNSIVRTGLQYVDRRRVRPDQYLQAGDLLLCMANGSRDLVGKSGRFVSVDEHRYTFGAFMGCFRPDTSAIDPDFVSFHLQTHAFRQHIDLLLAGSSINNLRPEGVLSFSIQIPTGQLEQQAISALLNDFDEEISVLEHRLTKAQALKQSMAQALLTGRIRLVEPAA